MARYMNRSYSYLFEEEEINNEDYVAKIMFQLGQKNGIKHLNLPTKYSLLDEFFLNDAMEHITSSIPVLQKKKYEKYLKKAYHIKKDNDIYCGKFKQENIYFGVLSELMEMKDQKEILEQPDLRKGKCHFVSLKLAKSLFENQGYDCDIVTGYISTISKEVAFLHSVVEISFSKDPEQKWILDFTKNLLMNKEAYNLINQFKEVGRVNIKDVLKDKEMWENLTLDNGNEILDYKTYLTCHEEIVENYQKCLKCFTK